jgi:hypothetical protein
MARMFSKRVPANPFVPSEVEGRGPEERVSTSLDTNGVGQTRGVEVQP